MAQNVTRHVQIILTLVNKASAPAARITHTLWDVVRSVRAVIYSFQGIAYVARSLVGVNQMFEDLQLSFAGILHSAGLTRSFADARGHAEIFVKELQHAAAVLPGTLQEYVEIASRSMPMIARAGFTDTKQMADYIGKYGAIAKAMQVGAPQAGRDLFLMLSGAARAQTRMFLEFKAYLSDLGIAQDKWKQMSVHQRAMALSQVFGKFQEMVNEFNNTWNTIWGTFTTNMQIISKIAFAGGFQELKDVFKKINEYMEQNVNFLAQMVRHSIKLAAVLGPLLVANAVVRRKADPQGMFAAGLFGIGKWAPSAMGKALQYKTGFAGRFTPWGVSSAIGGLAPVSALFMRFPGQVMRVLAPLSKFVAVFLSIAGPIAMLALAAGAIGLIAYGIHAIWTNFAGIRDTLYATAKEILGYLEPAFQVFSQIGSLLSPDGTVGNFFQTVFVTAIQTVADVINGILLHTTAAARYLAFAFERMGMSGNYERTRRTYELLGVDTHGMGFGDREIAIYKAIMDQARAEAKASGEARAARLFGPLKTPTEKPPPTVNNFYNARFNILQQFAEGADPDRIAVTFMDDVANSVRSRMSSQMAPVGAF